MTPHPKTSHSSAERPALVRGWWGAVLGAVVLLVLPLSAGMVEEFYSRLVYQWLQSGLTAVSNLVPFALLDALIVLTIVGILLRAIWLVRVAIRRGVADALWQSIRRLLRLAGVVVIAFVCVWGWNYRRLPLERTVRGDAVARPTVADLEVAVADANTLATSLRSAVKSEPEADFAAVADALRDPMNKALVQLKLPPLARPGRPKTSLLFARWFTLAGINGMINPFGLESIVNADLLPFERPFVLAHEWAHLAGQADEAEANAIGWYACMNGGMPLAYSASLYLIMEASSALPPDARTRVLGRLSPGVRTDLEAIDRRMRAERPRVRRAASRVYDEYLKANRVGDGTASYSRALNLILAPPMRDALGAYRRAK